MSEEKFITMSNEEYHSREELGSSDVRRLMISPLHYGGREEPAVRPPHFVFGSAAHCGYLEPNVFEDRYAPKPLEIDGKGPRTNYYKEWMATQSLEVEWMNAEDFDKVLRVVESALDHPVTAEFFKGEVVTEGSLFFKLNGVDCKARPDLVNLDGGKVDVLDLKTTGTGADPASFRKTVANNQLHVQEWFYRKALKAAGFSVGRFVFLVCEKNPPFATAAYVLNQEDVASAEKKVADALLAYRTAVETEVWAGYPQEVTEISLPKWAVERKEGANGNWITVKDAMKMMNISRSSVYNWMGRGVESRTFGGKRLVSMRSMVSMMDSWKGVG